MKTGANKKTQSLVYNIISRAVTILAFGYLLFSIANNRNQGIILPDIEQAGGTIFKLTLLFSFLLILGMITKFPFISKRINRIPFQNEIKLLFTPLAAVLISVSISGLFHHSTKIVSISLNQNTILHTGQVITSYPTSEMDQLKEYAENYEIFNWQAFKIHKVDSLNGIKLESQHMPGYFLCYQNSRVYLKYFDSNETKNYQNVFLVEKIRNKEILLTLDKAKTLRLEEKRPIQQIILGDGKKIDKNSYISIQRPQYVTSSEYDYLKSAILYNLRERYRKLAKTLVKPFR
ncbi:MAG: hypothetical protein ACEPOZ_12250 [Marinifilaceae bacterium]|jgi:hypothetical protein